MIHASKCLYRSHVVGIDRPDRVCTSYMIAGTQRLKLMPADALASVIDIHVVEVSCALQSMRNQNTTLPLTNTIPSACQILPCSVRTPVSLTHTATQSFNSLHSAGYRAVLRSAHFRQDVFFCAWCHQFKTHAGIATAHGERINDLAVGNEI